MRSIRKVWKMWDADEKFAKEVSSSFRKGKMQMQFTCQAGRKASASHEKSKL